MQQILDILNPIPFTNQRRPQSRQSTEHIFFGENWIEDSGRHFSVMLIKMSIKLYDR